MSQRLVVFAKYVLTMDRPHPIEDGFVMVQGHRIVQVGRRKDLYFLPLVRMLDLGNTLLLPGFINAHCHLDFTLFKGKVPYEGHFREWMRRMGEATRKTKPGDFRLAVQNGIEMSLAHGTTTLCDISTSWESYSLLRKSGLRAYVFLEILDVGRPSAQDYWKLFSEKLHRLSRELPANAVFRWGLSPHTPFTVSKELLLLAGRYLGSHKGVLSTLHVAESREESRYFEKGAGP